MAASFLVHASNAAITTMIAIVVAQRGGEQSDVSLIAACYALGFMLGCFVIASVAKPPKVLPRFVTAQRGELLAMAH
jgi:hypothetical protein